uniref:Uncharacterized protein n=1 Tax=Chenopodium quinoa TaxID=63459 RepID=A0A803LRH7_CHEQI
ISFFQNSSLLLHILSSRVSAPNFLRFFNFIILDYLMESSDEEGEIFPESVTDYQFINQENELVSFTFLPLLWPKEKPVDTVNLQMFLTGVSDDGLRKVFKQVVAWRYELSYVQPEISVFCKGDFWVKLLKPKKLFEPTIRSLLITVHCLHFVKHNVEATENSIWCHLSKVFSTYEVAPSEDDCMNHISLIRFASERDKTLLDNEIVDFCCGANEFSCLMKKKLVDVGKKCYFKNFDLFPSKNDFNFERRDWFSVQSGELAEGSRLIMGLNPPFGVKASLANQFINKALQFNPKLLIFIVPPETRRLDSGKGPTRTRYDLIWEDSYLLSGEAFYLPGSCDTREKQLSQWNNVTPPLYLWSHPDWTRKHREIAYRCGHSQISGQIPCSRPPTWNYILEEQQDCYGDFSHLMNMYGDLPRMLDDVPEHNHNPMVTNVAGQLEANVCVTPVDNLEDMDISPTNSPSYFIS